MQHLDYDNVGMQRQLQIYTAGMMQQRPGLPVAFEALEAAAREALPPEAFAYVAGGAGGERTMDANRRAFDRWRLVPRMLGDVEQRDLAVELFGRSLPTPLLMGPVGVLSIVHERAETAVAEAAAALGIPFVLSTVSSHRLEDVAGAAGDAPRWFQLYPGRDVDFSASLLQRAEAAGYEAVVITLDTRILAWRERDIQQAYLPFLHGEGLANYFSDPVFRGLLDEPPEENPAQAVLTFARVFANPALTWADVEALCARTSLPVILKGVLHPDDARAAVDHGAAGVVVSNHGGRQVDGAVGALEMLPEVVDAVGDAATVLFDSGIRRGADVVKALALGARAVLVGRPWVYGLALDGARGVETVMHNLVADLDLTLALSGRAAVRDLDRSLLRPA